MANVNKHTFDDIENKCYYFKYDDPKTKDKLDEWDRKPFILVLEYHPVEKYVLGINMHWIPKSRLPLFLYFFKQTEKGIPRTRSGRKLLTRMSYEFIKRRPEFKKTKAITAIRRYEMERMREIREVDQEGISIFDVWFKYKAYKTKVHQQTV